MIKFWYNGEEFNAKVESICGAHSAYVLGKSGFLAAEPDYTKKEVKGKNGDLTIGNNRYKNVVGTYHCAITHDYGTVKAPLTAWLASTAGKYFRLEDDDEPGYFRLARFSGYNEVKLSAFDEAARIDINFDCMPQKWLKSGETTANVASGRLIKIHNPTNFAAYPMITGVLRAGSGRLFINENVVTLSDISFDFANSGTVIIDCDAKRALFNRGTAGKISGGWFALNPGDNTISVDGEAIESIFVTPRWWTL